MGNRALVAAVDPLAAEAPPNTCIGIGDGTLDDLRRQHDQPLVPASNEKIVTTAAALDLLGADTTLETSFLATSEPVDGVSPVTCTWSGAETPS